MRMGLSINKAQTLPTLPRVLSGVPGLLQGGACGLQEPPKRPKQSVVSGAPPVVVVCLFVCFSPCSYYMPAVLMVQYSHFGKANIGKKLL